jgi:hypothetical protein
MALSIMMVLNADMRTTISLWKAVLAPALSADTRSVLARLRNAVHAHHAVRFDQQDNDAKKDDV